VSAMPHPPMVVDANRFLKALGSDPRIRYVAVGAPAQWKIPSNQK